MQQVLLPWLRLGRAAPTVLPQLHHPFPNPLPIPQLYHLIPCPIASSPVLLTLPTFTALSPARSLLPLDQSPPSLPRSITPFPAPSPSPRLWFPPLQFHHPLYSTAPSPPPELFPTPSLTQFPFPILSPLPLPTCIASSLVPSPFPQLHHPLPCSTTPSSAPSPPPHLHCPLPDSHQGCPYLWCQGDPPSPSPHEDTLPPPMASQKGTAAAPCTRGGGGGSQRIFSLHPLPLPRLSHRFQALLTGRKEMGQSSARNHRLPGSGDPSRSPAWPLPGQDSCAVLRALSSCY